MDSVIADSAIISQRNKGIDLLRVVAAFYIIIPHMMLAGGLRSNVVPDSGQQAVCTALLCLSFCCVNLFGIISGYVSYSETEKPHNWVKYMHLWSEVVFYHAILTLLTFHFYPDTVSTTDLFRMFLPVTSNIYWYFTAYTAVALFAPLLNAAVRGCSRNTLLFFLGGIVLFLSPAENLFEIFATNRGGYSAFWLIILYLIGAILKKTQLNEHIRPITCLAGIVALFLVSYFITRRRVSFSFATLCFDYNKTEQYVFPFHLLSAIFYVLLFSNLKPKRLLSGFISFAAPGTFAVYLLNTQPNVWVNYIKGHFAGWATSSPLGILARVFASAGAFVMISLVIDYFRRRLFHLFHTVK